jgi:hypothetical protein
MGNSSGHANKNTKAANSQHPNSSSQAQPQAQEPAASSEPQSQSVRTLEDKCNEIYTELKRLETDAEAFAGRKDDKTFLKIEEFLTICLLKLDEIERTDDRIRKLRKSLINFSHEISAKLEQKAIANGEASNSAN